AALVHNALRLALGRAARSTAGRYVRLVFEAAWGVLAFRSSRLRPEQMFQLAADGDLDAFASELAVYPAVPAFHDLAALLGAWLARDRNPGAAAAFRRRPRLSPPTDGDLLARGDAALEGNPPHIPPPGGGVGDSDVARVIAEIRGADLEGGSGRPPAESLVPGNDERLAYLSEIHGPKLVAFAAANEVRGRERFLEYIAIHASNQYPIYRDISL